MKNHSRGTLSRCLRLFAAAAFCSLTFVTARAVNLVQEFYLPMPEQQIYTALNTVQPGGTSTTQSSTYSIVVTGDGTVIVYDQWEDGYETDLRNPTQSSTQIWGDGNDANGIAPGFAHDPVGIPAGTVITLTNNVPLPRNPSVLLYDGRDRIGGSKALVVTHAGWPATQGPVFAGSVSVLSTIDYGTNYISPVGQDLTNKLFQYVGMFVMASENGTSVTIDPDGPGTNAPTTIVLNQGESYLVNGGIQTGASVTATKPIQADLLIGHINGSYAADWFTLTPVEQWSASYYTPVGSAVNGTQPTYVYLYNPNSTNITVNCTSLNGAANVIIASNGVVQFQMPQKSGASFTSSGGAPFYALSTVAANNNNDTAFNWGFSLLPKEGLTTEADVGWAPGSSTGTVNGSPVWVTALGATRIYVDYKGDHLGPLADPKGNKYDTSFDVAPLQSVKIFDPSKNQTGMRVYTLDGTLITAAWGEDADVAAAGNPYIDAGTVVLPFPTPILKKSALLAIDTGTPGVSVGDTLEYTVEVDNKGLLPLGNVVVLDLPPTNLLSYVSNSTTLNNVSVPDDASGTAFPLDGSGYTIPVILRSGTSVFKNRFIVTGGGQITNVVGIFGTSVTAQNFVSTSPNTSAVNFTDSSGNSVSSYSVGNNVFVRLIDSGGNVTPNGIDMLTVVITNLTHGDFETLTLTETGTNTGVFFDSTGIPTSVAGGASALDGTLNIDPGDTLQVLFTDPVYRNSASNTAVIAVPSLVKTLYLSVNNSTNGTQALNRIDPVFYGHGPTRTSADIGSAGFGTNPLVLDATNAVLSSATVNKMTNSLTVGGGSGRLMLVSVSTANGVFATNVTTTSGSTVSLTQVGAVTNASGPYVSFWYVTGPLTGLNSVVVQFNGNVTSGNAVVGVATFANVNSLNPFGPFVGVSNNNKNPTITVSVATNGWVFDSGINDTGNPHAFTSSFENLWAGASTPYASGLNQNTSHAISLTDTWTSQSNPNNALAGISINPSTNAVAGPASTSTSFTQVPTFASSFTVQSNKTITITNYITLTNGSFSGNPAVTRDVEL